MQTLKYCSSMLAAAFLLFAAANRAQIPLQRHSLSFTLRPLGHHVWAAIDDAKGDAGANAGFVIGDDGVAVIDTFENPEAAKQLLAEIRKLTYSSPSNSSSIRTIISTTSPGIRIFQQAGAIVFAQRNVRTWIHTENLKFFGKNIKPEQQAMVEPLGAPDVVYDSGTTLFLGSLRIDVRALPGHTGGDSVVFVPDAAVVFGGDLFWRNTLPNLIDAIDRRFDLHTRRISGAICPTPRLSPVTATLERSDDVRAFRGYLAYLRDVLSVP